MIVINKLKLSSNNNNIMFVFRHNFNLWNYYYVITIP